jgi:tRNA(Ile2) C34 agmatinyltransferase TiaS
MTTPQPLTCPNCGAPLKNDYECAYCGTRFRAEPGFVRIPQGASLEYYDFLDFGTAPPGTMLSRPNPRVHGWR